MKTLQSTGTGGRGPRAAEVAALGPWFHNLHLPDGTQTAPDHPLGDYPRFKWKQLAAALPHDLRGAEALDIGCNAGFYAFELARRGARVLAIDGDPHYLSQARWAAPHLDPEGRIEFRCMDVHALAHLARTFDLVLFMGVFYHLRYPLLALDIIVEKARGLLAFQSLSMRDGNPPSRSASLDFEQMERLNEPGWPKLAFIEHRLAGDPTNWWIPNVACIEALLRSAGMDIVCRPGHELFVCRRGRHFAAARRRRLREMSAAVGREVPTRDDDERSPRGPNDDHGKGGGEDASAQR